MIILQRCDKCGNTVEIVIKQSPMIIRNLELETSNETLRITVSRLTAENARLERELALREEGTGSAGQLSATQNHLQDMRGLVDKLIGKILQ